MLNKNKSKDVLIKVASRLFRIRGYDGVGLNDIIEESGIPKGSLYHYFPKGKEQLAIEAINHTKEDVTSQIQEIFNRFADPTEAFQSHILELAENFMGNFDPLGMPIGTIAGEKYSTSEPIRIACQSAFESWQAVYITKLLASGYSEKQSKDLSIVINAMVEGGILLSLTTKTVKPLQVIAEQIPLFLLKK
ncbi:TetR/AcrR family transcriptional regulator [Desulfosporosinus hippei]|uniref:TetR/AcrR family transcriptional regulator, lmrAB and yxaGH operons repressor n=1 Tax=Desulfosporosinus hippei DSM 8344 TaxID=1121419 RepID=A0A1G8L2U6_9FIRM|nr:TetR/AcrR family transcriptional regulator [Desulfosporosinus hippei]SDI50034.1 TetR/AcrR family transcriptional regulator, lmrAB and yxaGH operons repressor [Desulfosporosinus hippei DSM 8344]